MSSFRAPVRQHGRGSREDGHRAHEARKSAAQDTARTSKACDDDEPSGRTRKSGRGKSLRCSHGHRHRQGSRAEEDQAQHPRCQEVPARDVHGRPRGQEELAEFLGEVETFLSVLAPGLLARPLLEWAAAFRDQPIVLSDVEAYEAAHGNPFDWNLKEVSEALGPRLHKVCKGSAGVKLKVVLKIDGLNAWRVLAFWFQARSTNDSMSLLTMIMNPDRAKDLNDMMNKFDRWDAPIRDYEMKFEKDDISDKVRQAALLAMAPEAVVQNRLAGRRDLDNYAKVRCMIDDMIRNKREPRGAIKLSGGGNQPPPDVDQLKLRSMTSDFAEESSEGGSDTSSVQNLAESLSAIVESLNSPSKGKGKGKGKKGQWAQDSSTGGHWQGTSQNVAGNRQPWPQPKEAGRAIEKPKEKGKGKGKSGGKAKGKGKGLKCYVCGGIGHPARLCPV